jgi:hypothetical protein
MLETKMKRCNLLISVVLPVIAISVSGCGTDEPSGQENAGSGSHGMKIGAGSGDAPEVATTAGSASGLGRPKPEIRKLDVSEVLAIEEVRRMNDWEKSRPMRPDPSDAHELDRRRPVALYIVCQRDLQTPAANTMEHAECLVNCGYDVRIAVALSEDRDWFKSRAMATVCKTIVEINERLAKRISDEGKLVGGNSPLGEVVKLKPRNRPVAAVHCAFPARAFWTARGRYG